MSLWSKYKLNISCFPFFQDAKKDEAVRKAYKYLAALHEVRLVWYQQCDLNDDDSTCAIITLGQSALLKRI